MTDRAQFEAMLEALINDDQQAAKEIFHNIVVGKSRQIYEELLESDFGQDQGNPYAKKDDEGDEEEEESVGDEEESDDEADDMGDDEEGEEEPDFGGEDDGEEGEGDIEDRVMDLEDALEDLKAEFEQLLSQEGDEGGHDMDAIGDAGGDDLEAELGEMDMEENPGEEPEVVEMHHVHHHVNEYVNKVALPKHGDNGVNTRSAVAGKNDMGGTTANIAKNFSTEKGGTQGGLLKPTTTLQDGGNMNKPGANAGKTAFKKKEPGHGAEKKGSAPGGNVGAGTGANSKDGEKNTKSLISTKVR